MQILVSPKVTELMQRGVKRMQSGDFAEAERSFAKAVKLQPDFADAHCLLADARKQADKFDAALDSVKRALKLRPDWGEAWMLRGQIEALAGKFPDAEISYREAFRILGETPGGLAQLAKVLMELQRPEEALKEYDKALARAPGRLDIVAQRAAAYQG